MRKLLLKWLCAIALVSLETAPAPAATFNVSVVFSGAFRFSPANLNITVGDTVVWNGLASFHTVTPDNGVTEPFCGSTAQASCTVTFNNAGTFAYHCIPHQLSGMVGSVTVVASPGTPPTVSITNPPNNILFAAPATVPIGASASDSDGNVASVQFFTNGVPALTANTSPFTITLSNLAAGHYLLQARAIDNQALSATSAPVIIRVVNRPVIAFARGSNGPLQLQFNTATGVDYVVERSLFLTNASNFSGFLTNPGTGGTLQFSETNAGSARRFFRVRVQ